MAHKKKGGGKKSHSPTQANGTNGKATPAATFKEDATEDGAGPLPNGHAESPEAHAKPVNDVEHKTDGGAAEEGAAAAAQAGRKDGGEAAPNPGSQAMRDSQKALEQTVNNLRGDLRAETSRREQAEGSLIIYKAACLSLGASTLGFAALAFIAISRCKR